MPTKVRTPLPRIEPIVPKLRAQPFNDPAWLFEPKYDGFRGMVYLTRQSCTIYSKRQNALARFDDLRKRICAALPRRELILDGEIIAVKDGRMDFLGLLRGEGHIVYAVFDVLWSNGRDLRDLPLTERKKRLRRLLPEPTGTIVPILSVEERGFELLQAAARLDLEGIVAKRKADPYNQRVRWWKVKNPLYTQAEGRGELFERAQGAEVLVNVSGGYKISGSFDQGLPGDSLSGVLELHQSLDDELVAPTGRAKFGVVLAGRAVLSKVYDLHDLRITPQGAVSFKIQAFSGTAWAFSGFLTGNTITGRHTLMRGKKPLHGPWTAVQVVDQTGRAL